MEIKFRVFTKTYENKSGVKFPVYLTQDKNGVWYQLRPTTLCGKIKTDYKAFILTTDTEDLSKCIKTHSNDGIEYKTNIIYIDGYDDIEEMPKEDFDGSDFE